MECGTQVGGECCDAGEYPEYCSYDEQRRVPLLCNKRGPKGTCQPCGESDSGCCNPTGNAEIDPKYVHQYCIAPSVCEGGVQCSQPTSCGSLMQKMCKSNKQAESEDYCWAGLKPDAHDICNPRCGKEGQLTCGKGIMRTCEAGLIIGPGDKCKKEPRDDRPRDDRPGDDRARDEDRARDKERNRDRDRDRERDRVRDGHRN
jgi:hypothetical protein